jgi:biotin transport system substrate-specific component
MQKTLYKTVRCGIFAAIICVSSFFVIPVGTVPISFTLLAVMVCAVVLSPFEAFCATFVYVLMGAIGLPVFSGGSGGFGVLLNVTGGYIWSYPLLALTVSLFTKINVKNKPLKFVVCLFGCLIGIMLCYTLGTMQYIFVTKTQLYTALGICVVPFVPVDIIKSVVAVCIGLTVKKRIQK